MWPAGGQQRWPRPASQPANGGQQQKSGAATGGGWGRLEPVKGGDTGAGERPLLPWGSARGAWWMMNRFGQSPHRTPCPHPTRRPRLRPTATAARQPLKVPQQQQPPAHAEPRRKRPPPNKRTPPPRTPPPCQEPGASTHPQAASHLAVASPRHHPHLPPLPQPPPPRMQPKPSRQ